MTRGNKPSGIRNNKYIFYIIFSVCCLYVHAEQRGTASYYHNRFQGMKTSSGECFDNYQLTAAHRTLPFGTLVRVTNLENGKSVVVRINDRLAPRGRHTIDVSKAAAQKIDLIRFGIAKVSINVLDSSDFEKLPLSEKIFFRMQADTSKFGVPVKDPKHSENVPLMLRNIRKKKK